jgi:RHS repeat-associated protein
LTTYGYDALDNLTSVTQGPLHARTFVYDSLSRLTSATNPEANYSPTTQSYVPTAYTYDADGNVITKVDARGITTCYGTWSGSTCNGSTGYDAINRVLLKTYSDGTPSASFAYDQSSNWGITLQNPIGRLTWQEAGNNTAQAVFSYDPMGRTLVSYQCTPVVCGSSGYLTSYAYDLLGDVTSSTNGLGLTLTYSYNTGARLTQLVSSLNDANHPGTLLSNAHYNAAGSLLSASLGNGISETRTYDARLRLSGISDGATYIMMTIPSSGGYAPNGDILAANDSINGNWTYAYDAFNRLIGSNQNNGTNTYSYVYDRFGNRWQQNVTHGSGSTSNLGFDANNRIVSGVTYDAAGDTTYDGTTTYTFDAEGRITSAVNGVSGTSTYVYDAQGHRVRKTVAGVTTDFVYDLAGHEIASVNSSGSWTRGEVYAGGRHLVTYNSTAPITSFVYSDWLNTERVRAPYTGGSNETCTSLPFGDGLNCSTADISQLHFTGKEHDAESNLDNFDARYDATSMGRFMTPDPLGGHQEDPQTLNRYSYVRNNPLSLTDPTGLDSYLGCTPTAQNESTCQQEIVGYDKNNNPQTAWVQGNFDSGAFTPTQIGNDENGNLVDKTTGTGDYTASVNGSGVQFSNKNGTTSSTGVFVNQDANPTSTPTTFQDAGWANNNALTGFTFTLTNSKLEANQTEAGFFTFNGTPNQAINALMSAGFNSMGLFGKNIGFYELRSLGDFPSGANSGHFDVKKTIDLDPTTGVPSTSGNMHFGEHDPLLAPFTHYRESQQ